MILELTLLTVCNTNTHLSWYYVNIFININLAACYTVINDIFCEYHYLYWLDSICISKVYFLSINLDRKKQREYV